MTAPMSDEAPTREDILAGIRAEVAAQGEATHLRWPHGAVRLLVEELDRVTGERDEARAELKVSNDVGLGYSRELASAVARAEKAEQERRVTVELQDGGFWLSGLTDEENTALHQVVEGWRRKGREQMRERAAKAIDDEAGQEVGGWLGEKIRALPLEGT